MGERAVPAIELPGRPELTPFTEEEMQAIPVPAHGKILANQADWWGYADQAEAAVKGYRDYIRKAFKIEE